MSHPARPYPEDGAAHQQRPASVPHRSAPQQQVPPAAPAPQHAPPAVARAVVPQARTPVAPAVTSAPLATPAPLTRPPEQPGGPPPEEPPDGPRDRTGPSGRTSRLRIGWHAVPRAGLRRMAATPAAAAGLLLGRDQHQVPAPLRLFTPEPVLAALVGGVWAAQLLIFRAFSVGVRVVVVTTEPRAWAGFGERATGRPNRLTVVGGEPGGPYSGTAQTPLLTVYDLGLTGPTTSPPLGPWHSRLTILRQLDRPGVAALQEAELAVLQRLGGDEATLAAAALKLPPRSGQLLQAMNDDMMALIGGGEEHYLFLHQTGVEQQYVGLPRR